MKPDIYTMALPNETFEISCGNCLFFFSAESYLIDGGKPNLPLRYPDAETLVFIDAS